MTPAASIDRPGFYRPGKVMQNGPARTRAWCPPGGARSGASRRDRQEYPMKAFHVSRRACMLGTAAALAAPVMDVFAAEAETPTMKRGYVDGPYGQIHYRIVRPARSGKLPLMCLHASPLSSLVYDNWIREIGKDRIAVAPDTPGYGGSDTPPRPVEIADFATAMIRFMDEMKFRVVDVMGYHTGSLTSVELARRHPDRIRKVVIISAPNWTDEERAASRARVSVPAQSYEAMLESALDGYRKQGKGLFRDMPDEQYFDVQIERMRHYRTSNWGFRAAYNYDTLAAMQEVRQPLLVLNPEDDVYDKTRRVQPLIDSGRLRNARIHDFPGWTHGHMDVHTVEMADVVRKFLDG
jgi:pimeloyl-ACP methyl ester carboxylesterase